MNRGTFTKWQQGQPEDGLAESIRQAEGSCRERNWKRWGLPAGALVGHGGRRLLPWLLRKFGSGRSLPAAGPVQSAMAGTT